MAWKFGRSATQLHLHRGLNFDYNDLPGQTYKKVTEIRIPAGFLRALIYSEQRRELWLEAGCVSFDLHMDMYSAPEGWKEKARIQNSYVRLQDAPTRRAWFLYEKTASGPTPGKIIRRCLNPTLILSTAYQGTMYLPKVKFPGKMDEGKGSLPTSNTASPRVMRKLRHMITLSVVESDEDERISEADRDARLA